MPCDLGYKIIAKVSVPAPLPQDFKEEIKPPTIDQDLLDKIGEDDPEFLNWLNELDIKPLLKEALKRAKAKVPGADSLDASINKAGRLVVKGTFTNASQKKKLSDLSDALGNQFQMEVLAIVAEVLDYHVSLGTEVQGGETVLVLEGEKHTDTNVNRYLKVTKDKQGNGVVQFEHFASAKERDVEQEKFLGMAQKLGIGLRVEKVVKRSGHPIPATAEHKHFLKEDPDHEHN